MTIAEQLSKSQPDIYNYLIQNFGLEDIAGASTKEILPNAPSHDFRNANDLSKIKNIMEEGGGVIYYG